MAARDSKKAAERTVAILFYALVVILMYNGWRLRDEGFIDAERGVGYWLGIVGGVMLLLQFVYPMRKRIKALRFLGSIRLVFRAHIAQGLLAPLIILYHSNFELGATNSNVALFTMLVVAISGLIGRYLYSRVYKDYNDYEKTVEQLRNEFTDDHSGAEEKATVIPELSPHLVSYEAAARNSSKGLTCFATIPYFAFTSYLAQRKIWQSYKSRIKKQKGGAVSEEELNETKNHIYAYFNSLRKISGLDFYVRLFSQWHLFHLPFFILMVITGIVHVFFVHMY